MENEESKIFKLNVKNRFALLGILPKESNYVTIRLITNIRKKLDLSDDEIKEFNVVAAPNGGITWKPENEKDPKEIRIDNLLIGVIVEELNKLEKAKKITDINADLYEMFIQAKEESTEQKEKEPTK